MKKFNTITLASLISFAVFLSACSQQTAEQKVTAQTSKVYALNAEDRNLASSNAKSYFNIEWASAKGARGQFLNCKPSDSNYNGLVSCDGMVPQANGTYLEKRMYCGYKPELTGCSNEDTVK